MAKSLKELALAKMSGFRHTIITVPEWGGVKVVLREPSGEGWLRWQEIAKSGADEEGEVSVSEKAHRNLCADVVLFIDVLCDTNKQPVFSIDEEEQVREIYGPVHSRLLKQALDLINSADEAREKSQPPA
ncbi:phage tail assembly chaperone [Salmonella enterica]|uniref:phage tail assembly chaperone n=1 Tax=Salmonella enterica TaxID=28901 RepID=UPI0009ABD4A8|nr:phage tail assembly chaperone [Salmonella enterica]EAW2045833.1 phage tail protein [Salmonella enterica subsp. enterica]ECA6839966.1 phage tail protein [Salmonella enterica subsp. enterica serovar Thompson]ECD5460036.1 phage tail protein [Salmonella enterica subsp. enterica serovar Oranienburg]ECU8063450.1 phage tail protein [Salmonella enterica subsp. enterica serovar O rough]ECV0359155.1 phage tail protein [Salmonella enterica subsp. enterica serovar Bareilly]EDM6941218.1 phage tail prot